MILDHWKLWVHNWRHKLSELGCFIQKTTKISNVVATDEVAQTENQCSAPPSDQFSSMKLNEDDHSKLLSSKLKEITTTIKEKMTVKSPKKNRNVLIALLNYCIWLQENVLVKLTGKDLIQILTRSMITISSFHRHQIYQCHHLIFRYHHLHLTWQFHHQVTPIVNQSQNSRTRIKIRFLFWSCQNLLSQNRNPFWTEQEGNIKINKEKNE